MAKKPSKRMTLKRVQESENLPPPKLADARPAPEVDEEAWGDDKLTLKQRKFVQFYVGEAGGNATRAAQLAGYRDDNIESLRVTASRTLTNANVQRVIAREMSKSFGSAEQVRNSIAEIANGSAADYLKPGPDGKLTVDLERMAEAGALGLIHQIEDQVIDAAGSVTVIKRKLKLYDRLRALELLAKMNGQLVDRHEHSGEIKFHPITLDGDKELPA